MAKREHTTEPIEVTTLSTPVEDWTGARYVLRSANSPGGVAIIVGGRGEEKERADAYLFAAASQMHEALLETIRALEFAKDRMDLGFFVIALLHAKEAYEKAAPPDAN